ncbi:Sugar phosphate isomerase/epimerase [Kushneria avicenniae]|uniref:Sugar phosphate isomerase/epimerase n=1 Tax=Kushneria avicenniae TaxID=402385 RepID=A0A1I1N4C9_9GAMM|nr:sugar phosphate isomerase/epimerase [Kushneria avicenniae]SFC88650.1 Sugar phosphate isomerase/epimerase [Kushneria avicenniae]
MNRYIAALGLCATTLAMPAIAEDRSPADLPIAVQMYTLRDVGTLDEQLATVEAAGVTAVETVGTQDSTAPELKSLLDKHDIEAISSHVQLDDLRKDLQSAIDFNKSIGNHTIVVPFLTEEMRPTDAEGWARLGQELKQIAARLKAADMQLAYHNHDFEMVQYDGRTGHEIMMDAAGPDVLAELDLAWIARSGLDPAEYIHRFDGRIFAIHAKDTAPEGEATDEDGFKALGEGILNWQEILPAADKAGVKWYIIEHDQPLDAAVVVKKGATYLAEHLPENVTR